MRKSDSVRFEPYFKIQIWDSRSYAWVDRQKAYSSEDEALMHAPTGPQYRWRVVKISEEGREPIDSNK